MDRAKGQVAMMGVETNRERVAGIIPPKLMAANSVKKAYRFTGTTEKHYRMDALRVTVKQALFANLCPVRPNQMLD